MGEIMRWLMDYDQDDLFELLTACVLNVLFLALIALLLWPLGTLMLAARLAQGYGILWVVTVVSALLLGRIHHLFRMNLYDRGNAYVISNLVVSCVLQVGWAAFAVLTAHSSLPDQPIWMIVIVYVVAVLSCLFAFFAVSAFFQGYIYKLVSLPLSLASFLVFSVWPASARALYGWFFELF